MLLFSNVLKFHHFQSPSPSFDLNELASTVLKSNPKAEENELTPIFLQQLTMSEDQIRSIERHTRDQASSDLWKRMRHGRC